MLYTKEQIALAEKNNTVGKAYGDMVNSLIREKYNVSEELAMLRQRDEKPVEYAVYNAFVEDCKARAKEMIYGIS